MNTFSGMGSDHRTQSERLPRERGLSRLRFFIPSDWVLGVSLVAGIAALGLSSHIAFSAAVGEFSFFKGAYDEDTYFLLLLRDAVGLYRLLSVEFTRCLLLFGGGSVDFTIVALDALLPAMAACSGYLLSREIAPPGLMRVLCTLLLLFGQDLFSLGDLAVWNGSCPSIYCFNTLLAPLGGTLVPAYETSYLTLFRSPEPQLSLALGFALLTFLFRLVRGHAPGRRGKVALMVLILLMPISYIFVSLPLLLVCLGAAVLLAMFGRGRDGLWLALVVLTSGVIFSANTLLGSKLQHDLIFASHLPVVTPGVLASLVLAATFAAWCVYRRRLDAESLFTLILLAIPFIICNQQIITGLMVSARDWERNINYPLLIAGTFSAVGIFAARKRRLVGREILALASVFVCSVAIVRAQFISYQYFAPSNFASLAMARSIRAMGDVDRRTPLMLDQPQLAPLLATRLSGKPQFVLDWTETIVDPIPNMGESGRVPRSPHELRLFAFWQRTGVTPTEAERILNDEAKRTTGYFLGFIFALPDFWYPATDRRRLRQADIMKAIPDIIARYRLVLEQPRNDLSTETVIRLSEASPQLLRNTPGYEDTLIGSTRAGPVQIYAYRQSPK